MATLPYDDEELTTIIKKHEGGFSTKKIQKITDGGIKFYQPYNPKTKLHSSYPDAKGIWTIGHGHTGPEVVEGLQWTEEQANDALKADITLNANRLKDASKNRKENPVDVDTLDERLQRLMIYYAFKMGPDSFVNKYKNFYKGLSEKNWNILKQNYRIGHYDSKGKYIEHTQVNQWARNTVINPLLEEQLQIKVETPKEETDAMQTDVLSDIRTQNPYSQWRMDEENNSFTYETTSPILNTAFRETLPASKSKPIMTETSFRDDMGDFWSKTAWAAFLTHNQWASSLNINPYGFKGSYEVDESFVPREYMKTLPQEKMLEYMSSPGNIESITTSVNQEQLEHRLRFIDQKHGAAKRLNENSFLWNMAAGIASMPFSEQIVWFVPMIASAGGGILLSAFKGAMIGGGLQGVSEVGLSYFDPGYDWEEGKHRLAWASMMMGGVGVLGYGWRLMKQQRYGIPPKMSHAERTHQQSIIKAYEKRQGEMNKADGYTGSTLMSHPEVRIINKKINEPGIYGKIITRKKDETTTIAGKTVELKKGGIVAIHIDKLKIKENWHKKPWKKYGLSDDLFPAGPKGINMFAQFLASFNFIKTVKWGKNQSVNKYYADTAGFVTKPHQVSVVPARDFKLTTNEARDPFVQKLINQTIDTHFSTPRIPPGLGKIRDKHIVADLGKPDKVRRLTKDEAIKWKIALKAQKTFETLAKVKYGPEAATKLILKLKTNIEKKFPLSGFKILEFSVKPNLVKWKYADIKDGYNPAAKKFTNLQAIEYATKEIISWKNIVARGEHVMNPGDAHSLTMKHGPGLYQLKKYASNEEAAKVMGRLGMPLMRALRLSRLHFKRDNLLDHQPWELWNQGNLVHQGVDRGIAKPIPIGNRILREQAKAEAEIVTLINEAYAKNAGIQKPRVVTGGLNTDAILTGFRAWKNRQFQKIGFKKSLSKEQVISKSEFNDELGNMYIYYNLHGKFPTKEPHMLEALNKIKEFYIRWEKELMTAGLLPSIRNINRSKISLTRQLESKQKALNQWNKTKKILWEGKEPATIKRYYDNLAKEIDEIKGTVQQLDELKYMLSQEGKLASELYFPRMWRPDIIKENIDEFRQILYKYFEQNPTVARWSVSKGKVVLVNMNKLRDPITGAAKSIEERVENTIARILEEGDRMDIDGFITAVFNKQSKFRPFKHRELDIPNHLVAKFIETNIEYVSTTYARRVIPQLKIAQTYGDRFMANRLYELDLYIHTKYITPLEAKMKTLQESLPKLKGKELKKAKKEIKKSKIDMETQLQAKDDWLGAIRDLKDQIQGTLFIANPNRLDNRAANFIKNWTSLAMMGKVVIISQVDHGTRMMAHGLLQNGLVRQLVNYGRTDKKMLPIKSNAGYDDGLRTGELTDVMVAQSTKKFAETGEASPMNSGLERFINSAQQPFYIANLLLHHTFLAKKWSSTLISGRVSAHLMQQAATKGDKWAQQRLTLLRYPKPDKHGSWLQPIDEQFMLSIGIDAQMSAKMFQQLKKYGDHSADTFSYLNINNWANKKLANDMETMFGNEINRSVLMPKGPDRSILWDGVLRFPVPRTSGFYSIDKSKLGNYIFDKRGYKESQSKIWSLPTQFMGYGWLASQAITMRHAQIPNAYTLSGILSLLTTGFFVAWIKDFNYFRYRTPEEQIIRALELGGLLGIVNDLNIKVETLSYLLKDSGLFGYDTPEIGYRPAVRALGGTANPLWGEPKAADVYGELGGASTGILAEIIDIVNNDDLDDSDKAHIVRRNFPFMGLIWFNWLTKGLTNTAYDKKFWSGRDK